MFGKGISREGDILDLAADLNIVVKSGAWYAYEGNKIGQGRENAKQYLRDNPEICKTVEDKVRAHYGFGDAAANAEAVNKESGKTEAKAGTKTGGRAGSRTSASKAEEKAADGDGAEQENK